MNTTFSIGEALKFGFDGFKRHWKFLLVAMIASGIVYMLVGSLGGLAGTDQDSATPLVGIVVWVISTAVELLIGLGLMIVALKIVGGQTPQASDFWSGYPHIINYLVMSIVAGVAVMIGLVLLIVPGIILAVRLCLAPYFIIEQHSGPIAALKQSWAATKGNTLNLFLLGLVTAVLNVIGALVFMVGLLVTVPVTIIAYAWVYRKLVSASLPVAAPPTPSAFAKASADVPPPPPTPSTI